VRRVIAVVVGLLVAAACAGDGGELRPAPSTSSTTTAAPVIEQPTALIAPLDAQVLIEAGDARVIDLRSPEEFGAGHLPGAELYDSLQEGFTSAVNGLPRDVTYVVYDNTGDRAPEAARTMTGLGFLDVRELDGGFPTWQSLGLPVETS
jgi:rhodanese-related sulfurtransferase